MKQQLLESFGFAAEERFPVYADRFPIQLLSYLRLSRIQDVGLFAKVRAGRPNKELSCQLSSCGVDIMWCGATMGGVICAAVWACLQSGCCCSSR
jgi:hypothetical protein